MLGAGQSAPARNLSPHHRRQKVEVAVGGEVHARLAREPPAGARVPDAVARHDDAVPSQRGSRGMGRVSGVAPAMGPVDHRVDDVRRQ
eukprot:3668343-Alexandrium_andersonii.AAC.1